MLLPRAWHPIAIPLKHAHFLALGAEDRLGGGGHVFTSGFQQWVAGLAALGSPAVPAPFPGPPIPAASSPTPAGLGSALPVKAELEFSSFCIPHKALASVAQFFPNPLSFKNRH